MTQTPLITSCTITLASYSSRRAGKKMTKKGALEALIAGSDFKAFAINGIPTDTYCSIANMGIGTRIEMREGDDCIDYLVLTAKHFPHSPAPTNDIPAFMVGSPVELD
jgi:hypothetical protein